MCIINVRVCVCALVYAFCEFCAALRRSWSAPPARLRYKFPARKRNPISSAVHDSARRLRVSAPSLSTRSAWLRPVIGLALYTGWNAFVTPRIYTTAGRVVCFPYRPRSKTFPITVACRRSLAVPMTTVQCHVNISSLKGNSNLAVQIYSDNS